MKGQISLLVAAMISCTTLSAEPDKSKHDPLANFRLVSNPYAASMIRQAAVANRPELLAQQPYSTKMLAGGLGQTQNRIGSQLAAAYSMLHDAALTTATYQTNINILQDDMSPIPDGSSGAVIFSGLGFTGNGRGFVLYYVGLAGEATTETKALGDDICLYMMDHIKTGLGIDPSTGNDAADSLFISPETGDPENAITWALRAGLARKGAASSINNAIDQGGTIPNQCDIDVTVLMSDENDPDGFIDFNCSSGVTD
ncbi:MAG: hypothetical protein DHS20C11_19590 [Lysobacteraceae bacterium]|nr:MAG: hypothetical protein DHS20C11_19590 [Xanthomonadaceae bacterium]